MNKKILYHHHRSEKRLKVFSFQKQTKISNKYENLANKRIIYLLSSKELKDGVIPIFPVVTANSGDFVLSFDVREFVTPEVLESWLVSGTGKANGWSVTGSTFKCFSKREFFSKDFGSLLSAILASKPYINKTWNH